jgi:hypothetical protein
MLSSKLRRFIPHYRQKNNEELEVRNEELEEKKNFSQRHGEHKGCGVLRKLGVLLTPFLTNMMIRKSMRGSAVWKLRVTFVPLCPLCLCEKSFRNLVPP